MIDNPALRSYDGKPLIIGIRPEDFEDASMVKEGVPDNSRFTSEVDVDRSTWLRDHGALPP
ncbi:hypothetical protein [uncultured Ilumatobacter sp.]|uniref:hypothetical protein n=1 Tax=uncultured Ilumatobacter sp. TaxID=879968 RepID=UPI00374E3C7E